MEIDTSNNSFKKHMTRAGLYTGKIRFPTKRPKKAKDPVSLYGSRGQCEHNFQTQSSPTQTAFDVGYTGFLSMIRDPTTTSTAFGSISYHAAASLLRHILKKHCGVNVELHTQTMQDLIPAYYANPKGSVMLESISTGPLDIAKVEFIYRDDTNPSTPTYGTGYTLDFTSRNTDQFYTVAQVIAKQVITSSMFGARTSYTTPGGYAETDNRILYGYRVTKFLDWNNLQTNGTVNEATDVYRITQIYRLDNFTIHAKSTSVIYFQNNTVNDTGNTNYTTTDSHPIRGRIFHFKAAIPNLRTVQTITNATSGYGTITTAGNPANIFNDNNYDGIALPTAANVAAISPGNFKQIPKTDQFITPCTYQDFNLAPGESKKIILKFKFNGKLNKFIQGMGLPPGTRDTLAVNETSTVYTPDSSPTCNAMGTYLLFAFDKMLSTGSAGPNMLFQRTMHTSAYIKKRTTPSLMMGATGEAAAAAD